MAIKIWAGNSASSMTALPSPVSIKPTRELIWSENTGRAQSGSNKAKMIGDVVAQKETYAIQWGVLTPTELNSIIWNLSPGFFYFGIGASAPSNPNKFYRSEIAYEIIQSGASTYYKDVTVSVIQQ